MSQPVPTADVPPYPRHRRLRRVAAAVLALLSLVAGVRVWWGREAHRRLRERLDPMIAAGEPIDPSDFQTAPVPDDQNAAALYMKAAGGIRRGIDSPSQSNFTFPEYPPYSRRWHQLTRASIAANGPALRLVRQARSRRRADWGVRPASPVITVLLPHLNDARNLANVVADVAEYAHLHGDDHEALERVRDLLHLGRMLDTEPFLVQHLVSVGVEALTLYRIEVMAPALAIESEGGAPTTAPTGRRPATREQVRAVVADLLDDKGEVERLRRVLQGERMMAVDTSRWMSARALLLRPMYDLDLANTLDMLKPAINAATQPTWPAAMTTLGPYAAPPNPPSFRQPPSRLQAVDFAHALSATLWPANGYGKGIMQDMRIRAERRLAAVSLAAQLYRADHGAWPQTLEDLAPGYFPAVPKDPFAGGERPLGYVLLRGVLPGGLDRPVAYQVSDGTDDTAAGARPPPAPLYGWTPGLADQWRDLSFWRPAPATQPSGTVAVGPLTNRLDADLADEQVGTERGSQFPPASAQAGGDQTQESDRPGNHP